MNVHKKEHGFTIVELLIVVVVIALLAAITLVAYSGISRQAKASSAQSAVKQAATKISSYAVLNNGVFPVSSTEAGINDTGETSYQYRSYDNGTKYCVTATSGAISYFMNNDGQPTPTPGACSGHGVNGVQPITNMMSNAGIEASIAGFTLNHIGGTATASLARSSLGAKDGGFGARITANSAGTFSNTGIFNNFITATEPTKSYVASTWIRSTKPLTYQVQIEQRNAAGSNIGTLLSGTTSLGGNTWKRLSVTIPPNANMTRFTFCVYGSGAMETGDTVDFDSLMVTEGTTLHTYADGSSPSWIWNGAANSSSSTGPPL